MGGTCGMHEEGQKCVWIVMVKYEGKIPLWRSRRGGTIILNTDPKC